jgi:hypothetical protein
MRWLLSTLLAVAVTAGCLWFLLTPEVARSLTRIASEARPLPILAAFLLGAVVQWLRAWRFAVMSTGRLGLPGANLVRVAFQLNALNFILPFRLGELSYPVLMRRHYGYDFLHSAGVLLLARAFDLATVCAIMLGTAACLRLTLAVHPAVLGIGALALALSPFAVALGGRTLQPYLARLPHVGNLAARLAAGLTALRNRSVAMATVGLGFAIWLLFGVSAILVAEAVVATVSPGAAMLGALAGSVAFALPINGIAGIGPSQAAWVVATTQAGAPWNDAVLSALALHAVVLTNALVFGALATIPTPGSSAK